MSKTRKKRKKRPPHYPTIEEKKALVTQKKSTGCAKCGINEEWLIDLHHINPKSKRFTISHGVRSLISLKTFKAELRKTIPLCRNHHADFHHKQIYDHITLEEYLSEKEEKEET